MPCILVLYVCIFSCKEMRRPHVVLLPAVMCWECADTMHSSNVCALVKGFMGYETVRRPHAVLDHLCWC
jgi:hypothetical protein